MMILETIIKSLLLETITQSLKLKTITKFWSLKQLQNYDPWNNYSLWNLKHLQNADPWNNYKITKSLTLKTITKLWSLKQLQNSWAFFLNNIIKVKVLRRTSLTSKESMLYIPLEMSGLWENARVVAYQFSVREYDDNKYNSTVTCTCNCSW